MFRHTARIPFRRSPKSLLSAFRTLFVKTESTPNLDSLKFLPDVPVLPPNTPTIEYLRPSDAVSSPLATSLFRIPGIQAVMYNPTFLTVTKHPDAEWQILKPDVYNAVTHHLSSSEQYAVPVDAEGKVVLNNNIRTGDEEEEEDEVVAMIKELLETRIRPAIQDDGGDIEFRGFKDGIVKLGLKGACRTCDSSVVTLKNGVENMLKHYIPEVVGVEQALDEEEIVSLSEFQKLERKLAEKNSSVDGTN